MGQCIPTPSAFAACAMFIPLLAGCAGHRAAAEAQQPAVPENARAAVATVDRFLAALIAGELEAAAAELDPGVLILESGGAEFSAREYLTGHAKSDAEFLRAARIEPRHRTARASGDIAWVASLVQMETQQDGKAAVIDGAESMVLRRGPSGWKIVHIHWSSRLRR